MPGPGGGGGGLKPVLWCTNLHPHLPPQFTQFNRVFGLHGCLLAHKCVYLPPGAIIILRDNRDSERLGRLWKKTEFQMFFFFFYKMGEISGGVP